MKNLAIKLSEIACVVFLAAFIIFITGEAKLSEKTAAEVFEGVSDSISLEGLKSNDGLKLKKETGFSESSFDSFVYYSSDSIMDVREYMVIKLKDIKEADSVISGLEKRVEEKQILFDGYAPEQSSLLKNHILKAKSGLIYYSVGEDSQKGYSAFLSALQGG